MKIEIKEFLDKNPNYSFSLVKDDKYNFYLISIQHKYDGIQDII